MSKSYLAAILALLGALGVMLCLVLYFDMVPGYLFRPLPGAPSKADAVAQTIAALQANDEDALSRVSIASLDSLRRGSGIETFDDVVMQQTAYGTVITSDVIDESGERYNATFVVAVNRNIFGRWLITSWHQSP